MRSSFILLLVLTLVTTLSAQEASLVPTGVVHIITYLDLMPAHANEGRALLIGAVNEERKQRGSVAVTLVQEENRSNHLVLVETWSDLAALEAYRGSREYLAFRAALQPAPGTPFDERRGSQIAP